MPEKHFHFHLKVWMWKFTTVKNKLRTFQRNLNTVTDTTYGDYARDRSKKSELRNYSNYGGKILGQNLSYVITPVTETKFWAKI